MVTSYWGGMVTSYWGGMVTSYWGGMVTCGVDCKHKVTHTKQKQETKVKENYLLSFNFLEILNCTDICMFVLSFALIAKET